MTKRNMILVTCLISGILAFNSVRSLALSGNDAKKDTKVTGANKATGGTTSKKDTKVTRPNKATGGAAPSKKDTKVIGSNKVTGGEAPTDKPRMEKIQDDSKRLNDRVEREKKEREKKNSGNQ